MAINPTLFGYVEPPDESSWTSSFAIFDSGDSSYPVMQFDFTGIDAVSSMVLYVRVTSLFDAGSVTLQRNLSRATTGTTWSSRPATTTTNAVTKSIPTSNTSYSINITSMANDAAAAGDYFGITFIPSSVHAKFATVYYLSGQYEPYATLSSVAYERNDIYVDSINGSDSNVGTITYPLKTLDLAAQRVNTGGAIHIKRMPDPYENIYYPDLGQIAPTNLNTTYYLY